MTNLVSAYQNDDIVGFEEILKSNRYTLFIKNYFEELSITFYWFFYHRGTIMEDQFIREHIEELLRNIRQQVLVKLIRPYTRVRIDFLSQVERE